jgi:hypothetical protein
MTTMTDVPRSAEAVVVGLRETWAATQPPRCL